VVCVPPNAYTCGHNAAAVEGADTLHQIGGDFPNVSSVAYLDGYFAFSDADVPERWHITGLFDPAAYDALDFASTEAQPNVLRRILSRAGELWMFGEGGIEIWYDAGNADFPFRRYPNGVISCGVVNKTIAQIDHSFWWLGVDGIVYRSEGYKAQRVSTHAIEQLIYATGSYPQWVIGGNGYAYTWRGHACYALSVGAHTFVYDCATKLWHERSSAISGTGLWRPLCATQALGDTLLGDSRSGQIFFPANGASDAGVEPLRQFTLPPLWAGTRRAFCARLEIEMEVGQAASHGDVLLEWSDDGGWTWTGRRTLSAGDVGQLRKRVATTRLGSFRQRVFRVSCHRASTFYAVDADITGGVS